MNNYYNSFLHHSPNGVRTFKNILFIFVTSLLFQACMNAKNKLTIIKNQISGGDILLNRGSEEPLTLEEAKARLAYSETRYTEKHPDVIRYKR